MNAEHGKAAELGCAGRSHPKPQGTGSSGSIGMAEEANAGGNAPDMPTSVWSEKVRRFVEPFHLGIAIDEQHLLPGAPNAVRKGKTARTAAGEYCQIGEWNYDGPMGQKVHLSSGPNTRKGAALDGFEPCEAKVSRTVLRGAWAG